jgi:hypothetical protein
MTVETQQPAQVKSILQRSVVLVLRCGRADSRRSVDLKSMTMEKDGVALKDDEKGELDSGWKLFGKGDLQACNKVIDALKSQLAALSCDGGIRLFGAGAYLLPNLNVGKAMAACEAAKAQLAENVEALIMQLPEIKARRKAKLGSVYSDAAYPTDDEIRKSYRISHSFVRFGAPENLVEIDAAVAEQAEAEWNAKLSDAYADVVLGLRESAALVMRELARKLSADADGKPKALRPQALDDLNDLLQRLPVLNSVGQDEHLADALARVGALAQGVDVETLRKAPAVRAMLLEAAEKTAESLDALVLSGRRAMSFD